MITNIEGTQAISNLGWVDKGSLWVYRTGQSLPQKVELSDAKYLSLKAGTDDFFAAVHHWDRDKLEISAHTHADPAHTLARVSFNWGISTCSDKPVITSQGDPTVWKRIPRAFTGYASGEFLLFFIDQAGGSEVQKLAWFDNSYDKGYQGIVDVIQVPDSYLLIVSVQRDSAPVLYDPRGKQVVRKLKLAGRNGNPEFLPRLSSKQLWASDYDSIVRLDAKTLEVTGEERVQDAPSGTRQFIGNFCFNSDESLCLIARPFGSDAVALDADSMRQTLRVSLGGQPLDIALLGGTVITRDWKTGRLLSQKI